MSTQQRLSLLPFCLGELAPECTEIVLINFCPNLINQLHLKFEEVCGLSLFGVYDRYVSPIVLLHLKKSAIIVP